MSKYLFSVVAVFAIFVSFSQAKAEGLFRGWASRCGSSYSGPTYYAPPTYYYRPYYTPSCNSGYTVSHLLWWTKKGAAQKQAPSFQDLPQRKVNQPPKVKESTTNPPIILAPAPSFQDLPPKE